MLTALNTDPAASFVIPHALSPSGSPTLAALALSGVAYRCPACLTPVVLRAASRRARAHFAHHAACSQGESALHRAACDGLAEMLRANHALRITAPCSRCGTPHVAALPEYEFVGRELSLERGARPDLVLINLGEPIMAIEVVHTHRLDTAAMQRLGSLPWIELAAASAWAQPLLAQRARWHQVCPRCDSNLRPGSAAPPHECWNCGNPCERRDTPCAACAATQ